jgi:hypothetical protein
MVGKPFLFKCLASREILELPLPALHITDANTKKQAAECCAFYIGLMGRQAKAAVSGETE